MREAGKREGGEERKKRSYQGRRGGGRRRGRGVGNGDELLEVANDGLIRFSVARDDALNAIQIKDSGLKETRQNCHRDLLAWRKILH